MKTVLRFTGFIIFLSFIQVTAQTSFKSGSCSYGHGYWKNHSSCDSKDKDSKRDQTWDLITGYDLNGKESVGEETAFFNSKQDYCEVLNTNPGHGGKYYILAHQFIAAQLNLLNRATSTEAEDIYDEASEFLESYGPEDVKGNKDLERECVRLSSKLGKFNSNRLGSNDCDDHDDDYDDEDEDEEEDDDDEDDDEDEDEDDDEEDNVQDTTPPVIGTLDAPTAITSTSLVLSWSAATDENGVTGYNIYKDGSLDSQVGNVLSHQVTGLTPSTTYSFYITALDAEGNESQNSNSVQGTTLNVPTGQTMTMTTTSVSPSWQLVNVTNSGAVFQWEAKNDLVGTLQATGNAPEFDFGLNDGSPISIVISSEDDFTGLTELDLWNGESGVGSFITQIDLANAVNLERFLPRYSQLSSLDISNNTLLTELLIRGKRQLSGQALNTSNNPLLTTLWIDGTGISQVDLSSNPLLTYVRMDDANLSSAVLDQALIDLDNHGLSGGTLLIANQLTGQTITTASAQAYANLIAKNWTIDVLAPGAAKEEVSKVAIIPNPIISGDSEVSFKANFTGTVTVKLYNINGQIIGTMYSGELQKDMTTTCSFDLNTLDGGLYFAVFDFGDEVVKEKIVILK